LLVAQPASWASCSSWQGHGHLLWQHLSSLPFRESRSSSANKACWVRHSLCAWKGATRTATGASSSISTAVCRHYDEGITVAIVPRIHGQFVHPGSSNWGGWGVEVQVLLLRIDHFFSCLSCILGTTSLFLVCRIWGWLTLERWPIYVWVNGDQYDWAIGAHSLLQW